jgi:uncharacterized phage protein (TIGR02220 family)
MAAKKTLDANGLQDFLLGAVASSGIASGLPVFWAVGYLAKEAGSSSVHVTLDQLGKITGYSRSELTAAVKAIRVAGHRVEWHSKEDCTVTIDRAKGLKLMGPWMIEPEADVDASPVLDRLNELMGTKYRMTPQVGGMLRARMRTDKMTLEELIHVVEVKVQQWKGDEKMEGFLRPSTLFSKKAAEYAQERLREDITEEKVVSKEDLSRMWAG